MVWTESPKGDEAVYLYNKSLIIRTHTFLDFSHEW